MPKEINENLSEHFRCISCGSCCHFFEMIVKPEDIKFDNPYDDEAVKNEFKKQLNVEFDKIFQCSIKVNATCVHLDTKTGLCKIYETRPKICRNHFCQRYPIVEENNENVNRTS